jgi:hypothetical protein
MREVDATEMAGLKGWSRVLGSFATMLRAKVCEQEEVSG